MRKDIILAVLGLVIGFVLTYSIGTLIIPDSEQVILNIDSEEDWGQKAGFGWTIDTVNFTEGRLGINREGYGSSPFPESLETHSVYRTDMLDVSQEINSLEELKIEGYVSEEYESYIDIVVIDCASGAVPGDGRSQNVYCSSSETVYSTDNINESGYVERTEDLSDVDVQGNILIHADLAINETEPVESEYSPYIDSVKLTGR